MKLHFPVFVKPISLLMAIFIPLLSPSSCWAEHFGLKLMRPDSLEGWNYGTTISDDLQPTGWNISDGILSGTVKSTPLLSGFSAGDFELRFKWSVSQNGAWEVFMPKVPDGPNLKLVFSEGSDCGSLRFGSKVIFDGVKIKSLALKNAMHSTSLIRRGKKLSLIIDSQKVFVRNIPAGRYGLGLSVVRGNGKLSELRGAEPVGEKIIADDLFSSWDIEPLASWNGKLFNYSIPAMKNAWRVEDDELALKPSPYQFLRSKKEYSNFVLTFQYKIQKDGNSGIAIRVPPGGWPSTDGMELQICDKPTDKINKNSQMSIYGNVMPIARSDKSEEWNDAVIKADGRMISAWVNGELVQQYNTLHHPELKHRYPKGWIGFQDHSDWIRFRNIRFLEAPDGTGLTVWNKPTLRTASTVIVDRLMNPQSVSRNNGIVSGVTTKHIKAASTTNCTSSEQVIADLQGPGAIVRISYIGKNGLLSFYFDAEKKPRISCSPDELWQHVTPLNEDHSPVVTYLPYEKSLKILFSGTQKANCRIDYVCFTHDLPVETFSSPKTTMPRGWLEAPLYRQHAMGCGIHREYDPQLQIESGRVNLSPGGSASLVSISKAGLLRWIKLLSCNNVLENDDLWLSVTIDGEKKPAVSAPVRFWFPAFVKNAENYNNYLLVHRDGPANMLAMPFSNGLEISVENRGKHVIHDIGIKISVEEATDKTRKGIVSRPRLRGIFQSESNDQNSIFSCKGHGRWVGMICQVSKGGPLATVLNLDVDGKREKAWSNTMLAEFLGSREVDFRGCLSGCQSDLAWRYMLLAPIDFKQSIELSSTTNSIGARLALFYLYT